MADLHNTLPPPGSLLPEGRWRCGATREDGDGLPEGPRQAAYGARAVRERLAGAGSPSRDGVEGASVRMVTTGDGGAGQLQGGPARCQRCGCYSFSDLVSYTLES